jgi:hypothetical protein
MKLVSRSFRFLALLVFASFTWTGCETTDGGGSNVSGAGYYGVGFYDPWYYGDYDQDVTVVRPPGDRGAHVEQPIADPPRGGGDFGARPSPSMSMPSMSRGGGGGGGRRR